MLVPSRVVCMQTSSDVRVDQEFWNTSGDKENSNFTKGLRVEGYQESSGAWQHLSILFMLF